MNGDHAALVEYARRSHEAAEATAEAALRVEHAHALMQRELSDMRREMRLGFEALSAAVSQAPARVHTILTDEDWEDSPTGTHRQVTKRTWEKWEREKNLSADAKRWRKVLKVAGRVAMAVGLLVVGWLVRHFMGHP
jgi:hypothetical protein